MYAHYITSVRTNKSYDQLHVKKHKKTNRYRLAPDDSRVPFVIYIYITLKFGQIYNIIANLVRSSHKL